MGESIEHTDGMGSATPAGPTDCGHLPRQKHQKRMVQMAIKAGPEEPRRSSPVLLC